MYSNDPGDGERCRCEHRRVHPIKKQLPNGSGHIDRRRVQENSAPPGLEMVDVVRVRGLQQEGEGLLKFCRPAAECPDVLGRVRHERDRRGEVLQKVHEPLPGFGRRRECGSRDSYITSVR